MAVKVKRYNFNHKTNTHKVIYLLYRQKVQKLSRESI